MGIQIKNITTTSATLYYVGTSVDNTYKKDIDWYLDGSYVGSSVISPGDIGSNGCWLSGLNRNTSYSVRANITWYSGGGGTKVETASFKTLEEKPVINSISATPTKNTVWVSVSASYASYYDYKLYYRSGDTTGELVAEKLGRLSSSIEFDGLKASRQYRVNVTVVNSRGSISWDRDFTTLENLRPSNFYWSDGTRNAFLNNGYTNELKYTEWNSFVDSVKAFYMWYWNLSVDKENIESAKMSDSDKVLYATKFNKVRSSIGSMASTGLSDFSKGDKVMGSYFTLLEEKINSVLQPRSILEELNVPIASYECDYVYASLFNEADELYENSKNNVSVLEKMNNERRCY